MVILMAIQVLPYPSVQAEVESSFRDKPQAVLIHVVTYPPIGYSKRCSRCVDPDESSFSEIGYSCWT